MQYNYCTLFDFRYLSRGLALYRSLVRHSKAFHLYILAMDDRAQEFLTNAKLPGVTVIRLTDIETPDLLGAKSNRTWQEFCWTCTPAIIKACFERYGLDNCTYLDADIFFFSDPGRLLDSIPSEHVLITPHNYYSKHDQSATSGIYCVQFVKFSSAAESQQVLQEWYNDCIEWCYARFEDGKFGDQKYLDSWPQKYRCISVCNDKGAGLAPWNVRNYSLSKPESTPRITENATGESFNLLFYHFHDFYFNPDGVWYHKSGVDGYQLPKSVYDLVYKSYLRELSQIADDYMPVRLLDVPRVPRRICREDLECHILDRIEHQANREFLLRQYVRHGEDYELTNPDAREESQLLSLFLEADYNLSSQTLWHTPENQIFREMFNLQAQIQKYETRPIWSLARYIYRYFFK